MRTFALSLVLAACSAPPAPPSAAGDVTVAGRVTAVDLSAMPLDGPGRLQLRTDSGEVAVEIPSGEAQCEAEGLELVAAVRVGDRLAVTGAQARPDAPVVPCAAGHAVVREPSEATVSGEVLSVDLEPMTYDGSAVIMLRTEAGEQRVEIPARTNLCQADGLDIALAAQPGDRLTVTGEQTGGALVPCADSSHAVRRG